MDTPSSAPTPPRDPFDGVADFQVFGEFGEVNPSISDGSTFTFLDPVEMEKMFHGGVEGCFLYSRQDNPSGHVLGEALARLEGTEGARVTASGMAAIAVTLFALCRPGQEILAERTVYGGTYALLRNFLPRFGIATRFLDLTDLEAVRRAFHPGVSVVYAESLTNPLLRTPPIRELADLAHAHGVPLVVDNTFAPLVMTPAREGADVVVHSLTKFINGMSDCVGGAVCASRAFLEKLGDVHEGPLMLLGPSMDSLRAAQIYKNLHTLPLRMKVHGANALTYASRLEALGYRVRYPGLAGYVDRETFERQRHERYGYGGLLTLDAGDLPTARQLILRLQEARVGWLAVSLGFYRTLFSPSGASTSSEIPPEEQAAMGLGPGLVRISVGLDHDIERSWQRFARCLEELPLPRREERRERPVPA